MAKFLNIVLVIVIVVGVFTMALNDPDFAKKFSPRNLLVSMGILGIKEEEKKDVFVRETLKATQDLREAQRDILEQQKRRSEDLKAKNDQLMQSQKQRTDDLMQQQKDHERQMRDQMENQKIMLEQKIQDMHNH